MSIIEILVVLIIVISIALITMNFKKILMYSYRRKNDKRDELIKNFLDELNSNDEKDYNITQEETVECNNGLYKKHIKKVTYTSKSINNKTEKNVCPYCGAPIKKENDTCEYCKSYINV